MKVTEHGNRFKHKITIKFDCETCHCKFEAEEVELEGNSSRICWCPECKAVCSVSEREITRQAEMHAVAQIRNK